MKNKWATVAVSIVILTGVLLAAVKGVHALGPETKSFDEVSFRNYDKTEGKYYFETFGKTRVIIESEFDLREMMKEGDGVAGPVELEVQFAGWRMQGADVSGLGLCLPKPVYRYIGG